MKRANLERNIVVILFIMVLIIFSFADRASKKYLKNEFSQSIAPQKKENLVTARQQPATSNVNPTR